MTLVVDSSIAVSWGMPDENPPAAEEALARLRGSQGLVPALFFYEFRNVLLVSERKGRITRDESALALKFVNDLGMAVGPNGDDADLLGLARHHNLTIYDTAYLELALRKGAALATLDRKLATAARAQGLHVIGDTA